MGKIAGSDKIEQGIHDFPRETIERNKKINEAIPPMRKTSLLPGLGPSRKSRCIAACFQGWSVHML